MSKIRKANTIVLLERRLADVENAASPDAMELIGLQDEFQRVERKWREQIAAGSDRRQPGDSERLEKWFERLQRQINRALRTTRDEITSQALRDVRKKIADRNSDTN